MENLSELTLPQLKKYARQHKVSSYKVRSKSEMIQRINSAKSLGGQPRPKICFSKFTKSGRPYHTVCSRDSRIATAAECDSHEVPLTTVSVGLGDKAQVVGKGVRFSKGKSAPEPVDTVLTDAGGGKLQIEVVRPDNNSDPIWTWRNKFVFGRQCVKSSSHYIGGLLAVDSQKSVLMQYCNLGIGGKAPDCSSMLISIEMLETEEEKRTWMTRVNQYANFDSTVLSGGYSLGVEMAWLCDSSDFVFTGENLPNTRGGLCGFVLVSIPPGCVFKPLRSFMLDASHPGSWTNGVGVMCSWLRQKLNPYSLMEKRFVSSGVRDLMEAMNLVGKVPNTISAENFGILYDTKTRKVTPVVMPCMDVVLDLPNLPYLKEVGELNVNIVYNSVVLGVMRDGGPSDYKPSPYVLGYLGQHITDIVDKGILEPLGLNTTETSFVINSSTRAPLITGIKITDAVSSLIKSCKTTFKQSSQYIKDSVKSISKKAPWFFDYLEDCGVMKALSIIPHTPEHCKELVETLKLLLGYYVSSNAYSLIEQWFKNYTGSTSLLQVVSAFLFTAPNLPKCSPKDLERWESLKKLYDIRYNYYLQNVHICSEKNLDQDIIRRTLGDYFIDSKQSSLIDHDECRARMLYAVGYFPWVPRVGETTQACYVPRGETWADAWNLFLERYDHYDHTMFIGIMLGYMSLVGLYFAGSSYICNKKKNKAAVEEWIAKRKQLLEE